MKQKRNRYLSTGIFIIAVSLGINHFVHVPDMIYGFGIGLGLCLESIGFFAARHDMSGIRNFKKRLLHAFTK